MIPDDIQMMTSLISDFIDPWNVYRALLTFTRTLSKKMANQIHIHNYHAMDNRSLLKLQQHAKVYLHVSRSPDSKVHGANMGPIWVRQDPGGPHICPMNFASWVVPLWVVWYLQLYTQLSQWWIKFPTWFEIFCNYLWLSIGRFTHILLGYFIDMMTSSNGNIFRVTGYMCGDFIGPRWIPRTKASDEELWCFLWSASE